MEPAAVVLQRPPPNAATEAADLCVGCYPFAREAGQEPPALASAVASRLRSREASQGTAVGPYLNLHLKLGEMARASLHDALCGPSEEEERNAREEECGEGRGKHIVLEFSSPNTNKPQHLGHIRNNLLGDSVRRLWAAEGHKVTSVNLINDRGIHICKQAGER